MKKSLVVILCILLILAMLTACTSSIPSLPPVTGAGVVYTHEGSGFSITYPESWYVLSEEEITDFNADASDTSRLMYKDPADLEKTLRQNIPTSKAYLYAPDDTLDFDPGMTVFIMKAPSEARYGMYAFARIIADGMKKLAAEGVLEVGEIGMVRVGGLEAAVIYVKTSLQGMEIVHKQYWVAHDGYVVMLIISALSTSPSDLDILQKAVDNVRFE